MTSYVTPLISLIAMLGTSVASNISSWAPDTVSPVARAVGSGSGQTVLRAHDGLFYVTALVNDRPIRFLVDTGASHVVLTAADARRAGLTARDGRRTMLATANGRVAIDWTTLRHVAVGRRATSDVQAAVAPAGKLPVSLLGQDFLSRLESVRIEGDRLLLI